MPKRSYSDREKAEALATLDSCGGNVSEASRKANVPRITLTQWRDGQGTVVDVSSIRHEKRGSLADALEAIAWRCVELAVPKAEQASFQHLMLGGAIAIDKARLLRELPTTIIESREMSDDERTERIAELLAMARKRREEEAQKAPSAVN